jgi:hypothetical protein
MAGSPSRTTLQDGRQSELGSARPIERNAIRAPGSILTRKPAALQTRLVEKIEVSGVFSMKRVDPLERAAIVNRLRRPDDEIDQLVRIVELYLSGGLCATDWRLWLRRENSIG